jgi:hypothetical protein
MNFKRTATLTVVAAALAAWLAAAVTSGNREPAGRSAARTLPIDTRGVALADEISRLHERLRPSAVPLQPGRNLFSFTLRPPPAPPPAPPPQPALSEASAARPAAPAMKLSGMAEDVTADGVVRTAIISAFGQLFVVKEGDPVTARYRVAKISSDVVELSDLTEGTSRRLAMK